ncbi:hypothetical protein CPC08DRAFT_752948 [Agrocybe pediades]|nr:hypothetical protein CPC08DRAFT_752948 [Agrocybe pediades]
MRSFIGLLIFVLCFLEVVFAVPAPVGSSHSIQKKGAAKVKREEVDFGITRRSFSEFLGFHGTTSPTAAKYMKEGKKEKPLPILPRGFFNGNNAELAPGIYVTDTVTTANNRKNKGETSTTAMVCMVEAFRTPDWIGRTPKIWEQMAKCEGFDPKETVRFSALDIDNAADGKPQVNGNQVAIPTTQFNKIFIRSCMEIDGNTTPEQVLSYFQKQGWPQYSYSDMKEKWNIKP